MGHVCLLSIQRQLFVPLGQISLSLISCSFSLIIYPLSSSLISLLSGLLRQINLLCAENFVLGVCVCVCVCVCVHCSEA